MAYFESGFFCSAAEYEKDKERRVNDDDFRLGELYSLAMKLQSQKREASKLAVRAIDVKREALTIIRFAFVNKDLEPIKEFEQPIQDGLLNSIGGLVVTDTVTKEDFTVTEAFCKDYFEDQFGGILSEADQLSMVR